MARVCRIKDENHELKQQGRLLAHSVKASERAELRSVIWDPAGVEPLVGLPYLRHIEGLMPTNGRGPLPDDGHRVPDEAEWLRIAMRAEAPGVRTNERGGVGSSADAPLLAATAILEACNTPLESTLLHTIAERLVPLIEARAVDRLVDVIRADRQINRIRVAELARWLCAFGVSRGQVATGISLLGIYGRERDRHLIARIGLVDPLTLYSVVALGNLLAKPETAIFDLAVQVEGWGRIHAVAHLAGTTNPRIQDWLLRGGYDSDVMVEELAFIAATTGGLVAALQGEVDDDLLDHAGILLDALAMGGPAEDMSDYEEGALALELYFGHMMTAAASVDRLANLGTLACYLEEGWPRNSRISERARARLRATLDQVLARPEWKALVEQAVHGDDLLAFCRVFALTRRFGIDHRPVAREWLERRPHHSLIWQELLEEASVDELHELLDVAAPKLFIEQPPQLGAACNDDPMMCFDSLLYELRRFPGEGWQLIQRGLRADGIRLRWVAVAALQEWERGDWPSEAALELASVAVREPDDALRDAMEALLT